MYLAGKPYKVCSVPSTVKDSWYLHILRKNGVTADLAGEEIMRHLPNMKGLPVYLGHTQNKEIDGAETEPVGVCTRNSYHTGTTQLNHGIRWYNNERGRYGREYAATHSLSASLSHCNLIPEKDVEFRHLALVPDPYRGGSVMFDPDTLDDLDNDGIPEDQLFHDPVIPERRIISCSSTTFSPPDQPNQSGEPTATTVQDAASSEPVANNGNVLNMSTAPASDPKTNTDANANKAASALATAAANPPVGTGGAAVGSETNAMDVDPAPSATSNATGTSGNQDANKNESPTLAQLQQMLKSDKLTPEEREAVTNQINSMKTSVSPNELSDIIKQNNAEMLRMIREEFFRSGSKGGEATNANAGSNEAGSSTAGKPEDRQDEKSVSENPFAAVMESISKIKDQCTELMDDLPKDLRTQRRKELQNIPLNGKTLHDKLTAQSTLTTFMMELSKEVATHVAKQTTTAATPAKPPTQQELVNQAFNNLRSELSTSSMSSTARPASATDAASNSSAPKRPLTLKEREQVAERVAHNTLKTTTPLQDMDAARMQAGVRRPYNMDPNRNHPSSADPQRRVISCDVHTFKGDPKLNVPSENALKLFTPVFRLTSSVHPLEYRNEGPKVPAPGYQNEVYRLAGKGNCNWVRRDPTAGAQLAFRPFD